MDESLFDNLIAIYKKPRNKGKMENPSISAKEENTSCGDSVEMFLKIEDGQVIDASFEGRGCVISMASADILTGYIKGKSVDEVEKIDKEELLNLLGLDLRNNPIRLKCALIALSALRKAISTK
ncbi:MAG: iron-sulfur cluster assembly scaffold protein [Methanobacteriota archaeon]|nr:MAG: iron-sulfur cluster assembly scaffold protein [Euryarchaeota archaeon]